MRVNGNDYSVKRGLKSFWLFCSVFFLFVGPVINFFNSIYLNSTHLYFSFFFLIVFLIELISDKKLNKTFYLLVVFWIVPFSYFLLVTMKIGDLSGFNSVVFSVLAIIVSYTLADFFYKVKGVDSLEYFFKVCFFCVVIWGSVIMISYLFPSFRSVMDLFFYRDYSRGDHLVLLRVPAFHPTGGDGASMNLALLILISSGYLYFLKNLKKFLAGCILILCLFASLLSARTGFVLCVPLLLISFLLSMRTSVLIKLIVLFCFIMLFILLFLSSIPFIESYKYDVISDFGYEHPLSRSLIMLDQFSSGGVSSTTAGTLFNMIVLPNDAFDLVFGSGDFSRFVPSANQVRGSDVGYIRILNGAGLIGSILIYAFFLYPLLMLFLMYRRFINVKLRDFYRFFVILFSLVTLFLFLGNFKIIYLLSSYANLMFFSLFFILILQFYKAEKYRVNDTL
ncbi:oligosaccharide repeat unit polymerase [Denitrificimonas caeni]|uniref:oligosaccharide repeat unit polymerase n=1 Tax=Denitrificimonas caeni TaxID=521720 RepID=UPI00196378AF|nr:oligosaccharide repeat unit polymerase [Denitrificimonas caeni]